MLRLLTKKTTPPYLIEEKRKRILLLYGDDVFSSPLLSSIPFVTPSVLVEVLRLLIHRDEHEIKTQEMH
jgi:hypothetical protein